MSGTNVTIKQEITKKKRIFITPDGKKYEGGPEDYFGNDLGGTRRTEGVPREFKKT